MSGDFENRKKLHLRDANYKPLQVVHRAIRKYGDVEFGIIEEGLSLEQAKQLEIDCIEAFGTFEHRQNGYNLTKGGDGLFGYKHTKPAWNKGKPMLPHVKEALRTACVGRDPWNKGLKGIPGHPHTEETKQQMSEGKKGPNNPMYGKPSHRRRPVIVEGKYYATIHEAADKGPCSVKTLYKWLKEGKAVYAALD